MIVDNQDEIGKVSENEHQESELYNTMSDMSSNGVFSYSQNVRKLTLLYLLFIQRINSIFNMFTHFLLLFN